MGGQKTGDVVSLMILHLGISKSWFGFKSPAEEPDGGLAKVAMMERRYVVRVADAVGVFRCGPAPRISFASCLYLISIGPKVRDDRG